jgi:hypothetical protein
VRMNPNTKRTPTYSAQVRLGELLRIPLPRTPVNKPYSDPSPKFHRRFIILYYANRVVQDEGAALGASSEGNKGEDSAVVAC